MSKACFSCAISLKNSAYYSENGHSYCQRCYEAQFCPTCTRCNQKIKGEQKSLAWNKTVWHHSCFNCAQCNRSLVQYSGAVDHKNLPYCSKCYNERFSPKCHKCREPIEQGTSYIDVNADKLHSHCFKCAYCNVSLVKQPYYDHNGASYCQNCDSERFCPKCASCGGIIRRGTTYSEHDGQMIHNTCFTCFACGQTIGDRYAKRNSHNYHPHCLDNSDSRERRGSLQKSFNNNHTLQNHANHRPAENIRENNTNDTSTITPSDARSSRPKTTITPRPSAKLSTLSNVPKQSNNHTSPKFSEETTSNITQNNSNKEPLLNVTPQMPKHAQTSAPHDASVISPFYNACRDNDLDLVERGLKTMSLEEINKIEPNGSTALHVASYRGHEKIVELLLGKGASHSAVNKYNNTPLDEAKTEKIKQLLHRRVNKTRFVSESIEWILPTSDADFQAKVYSNKIETYGTDPHFYRLIIYIKENYLEKDLQLIDGIDQIKEIFDMAIKQKDPLYLLRAYTADTGFYSALNFDLAKLHLENLTAQENLARAYYLGIIAHHPKLVKFSYIGIVCRGMMITKDALKQYKVGTRILTKTFSSASKEQNIALGFLNDNLDSTDDRLSTMCIYEIRNQRTALDIESISLFTYEQEVLILPYSAFKIVDIQTNKHNSPRIQIKLKECEPW